MIVETSVSGNDSNQVLDKVFLLSTQEARQYITHYSTFRCTPTAYAKRQGASVKSGCCYWWLRSSGNYAKDATIVLQDGDIWTIGISVANKEVAVRPALWVDLDALADHSEQGISSPTLAPTATPKTNSNSKFMSCELCGIYASCSYTTSLGLSFWACSSCRSWMLGN